MSTDHLSALQPDSSRPARTSAENHRAALAIARRHMGHVAWPTVFVSLGSLAGLAVSSAAALAPCGGAQWRAPRGGSPRWSAPGA
ncbi:MAG: hypothetical protein RIF42_16515, partial [Parvibaculaceae bacterium]